MVIRPNIFDELTAYTLKFTLFSFLVLFICMPELKAQDTLKLMKEADKKFKNLAFIDAIKIYTQVAEMGYDQPDLYRKLADSYYFTGQEESSVRWYELYIKSSEGNLNPEYVFRFAQSLKSLKRYEDSDNVMEQFNKLTGYKDKRALLFENRRNYLEFIELQSGRFEISSLAVNSPNSEHAPNFDPKGNLIFASSRGELKNDSKLHQWNKLPFLDLYVSKISEGNQLGTPSRLNGKINTKFHESTSCFNIDGSKIYFTRNNFTDNKLVTSSDGIVGLKIYQADYKNGEYDNIVELPFCSDEYSVAHPAVSPNGNQLYFASDMPGSLGESDLYVVDILPGGKFSKPRNLGEAINTEGRETFPFISDSGNLYFSSDGRSGLGGLDIYISVPDDRGFFEVYNLGRPVNSPKDDFTFIINEKNNTGYFASNRQGGNGDDDIYAIRQTKELITSCKQYIEGVVVDFDTGDIIPNTLISLINMQGEIEKEVFSDNQGKYELNAPCNRQYLIRAAKDRYLPVDKIVETTNEFERRIYLSIAFKKEIILSNNQIVAPGDDLAKLLELNPIYFEYDDATINYNAEIELQKIIAVLQQNPTIIIEIGSHTDNRSSYWYNKKLSLERMKSTVNYIIEKGNINWRRVRGRAYGERKPLIDCTDDHPCSEEQHQKNRRSEFIIIKT